MNQDIRGFFIRDKNKQNDPIPKYVKDEPKNKRGESKKSKKEKKEPQKTTKKKTVTELEARNPEQEKAIKEEEPKPKPKREKKLLKANETKEIKPTVSAPRKGRIIVDDDEDDEIIPEEPKKENQFKEDLPEIADEESNQPNKIIEEEEIQPPKKKQKKTEIVEKKENLVEVNPNNFFKNFFGGQPKPKENKNIPKAAPKDDFNEIELKEEDLKQEDPKKETKTKEDNNTLSKLDTKYKTKINNKNEDDMILDEDMLNNLAKELEEKPKPKEIKKEQNINQIQSIPERKIIPKNEQKQPIQPLINPSNPPKKETVDSSNLIWIDKYNPKARFELIGNKKAIGDLSNWLKNWKERAKESEEESSSKGQKVYNSVLISGVPGIGKTCAVRVLAKIWGYSTFELNASNRRNKENVNISAGFLMNNTTLTGGSITDKNLIVMDEIDGMAGNEDKGGIKALIGIIKKTKNPVVFICNDPYNQKLKSLLSYCLHIKFEKPSIEEVFKGMQKIIKKENLSLTEEELRYIIQSFDCDIRQIITYLQMFKNRKEGKAYDKKECDNYLKDKSVLLTAFDVCKILLTGNKQKQYFKVDGLDSLLNLFFVDFELIPNLIQENYIYAYNNDLKSISEAADYMSLGDCIDRTLHTRNEWSLLPDEGMFNSIIPSMIIKGSMEHPKFPSLFSKLSSLKKIKREVKELKVKFPKQDTMTTKEEIAPIVFKRILNILEEKGKGGVDEVVVLLRKSGLNAYLFKEVLLNLQPEKNKIAYNKLNSGIKTALTRKLNDIFKTSLKPKASKMKKTAFIKTDTEGNIVEEGIEESESSSSSFFEPIKRKKGGKGGKKK
ncbi:MAG: AAA family ATPase [archaeon]|nr:AAA family ATPase [archaeon]